MATNTQIQDKFFNSIIEQLDEVNANEWEHYIQNFEMPANGFNGNKYNGENALSLYLNMIIKMRKTNFYATFKAISSAGGKIKKGSKSTLIQYGNFVFVHKETGKKYSVEQFREVPTSEHKNFTKFYFLKVYPVFNFDDIENIEEVKIQSIEQEQAEDFNELLKAESFISTIVEKGNLTIVEAMRETGAYNPSQDIIKMPLKSMFTSESAYYSTLFHEVTHWTRHESRLNRAFEYNFEELIAEIGSMLMCLQFGITDEFINSLRYLKGWSSSYDVKEERAEALKDAFSYAKKAKKYLENFSIN